MAKELTKAEKKELQKILSEIERMKKEEHIRFIRPFAKQQQFHLCGKRNAWALGGNRCLVAGQMVYMADGTTKAVEDVVVGDTVLAYDIATRKTVPSNVIGAGYTGDKSCREITFYGGNKLECSDDHPILTEGNKWLLSEQLNEYSFAVTVPYYHKKVVSIRQTGIKPVYDITIDHPDHAFIANGIVVHNTGKTESGAIKAVFYALGESIRPYLKDWSEDLREQYEPLITRFGGKPTRGWVCSVSFEVQRDVTQKKILGDVETGIPGLLPLREIKKITYRSTGIIDTIRLNNGSLIGFKSYDQGREKFQGSSQHYVWMDEEGPKDIYTECQMRLMDTEGDMFGTMTPLSGMTYVYDTIYLNDSKPIEKRDDEIFCMMMQWDDNPHLSTKEKKRLETSLDEAELEARKYGRFIMPGKCSFNIGRIAEMQDKCYDGERGNLVWTSPAKTQVYWVPDEKGEYEVWFHPEPVAEYLIPADVAEGLEHGDFDAVGVINRHRLRLDAVYHGHIEPDILADYMHRLAIYYGMPMLIPELNNHGGTTISHLKRVYYDIYRTRIHDKRTDTTTQKLGFLTGTKTRPLVVDAIKKVVREGVFECYWKRFVDEAMNFVRHPNGKEAARGGQHDDVILMSAIGVYVHMTTPLKDTGSIPFLPGQDKGVRIDPMSMEQWADDNDDEEEEGLPGFYGM